MTGGQGGRDLFRCSLNLLSLRAGGAWFPAFAGMTGGWESGSTSLTLFGCLSAWPRSGVDVLSLRVGGAWFPAFAGMTGGCWNDGGLGAGVHVPYTLRLSQCLAAVWGRRAVPEGWGRVDSGFRRKDGGGAGKTGGWEPGSTSLTRFGCLSAWPRSGVDALSLRVGGAWIPAFAGKTCGGAAGVGALGLEL